MVCSAVHEAALYNGSLVILLIAKAVWATLSVLCDCGMMEFKYEFDQCLMVMQLDYVLLHKESTIKYF
ncbi:hypothetical protein OUZ56_020424 [Daphnia magna]|uniref:Uncharacterized protein n=1 Tax=Daphnia magna TaxID=35525 RepID=A0ABQ9ZEF7_9CRUS|nr:hypothetical protein OUZ56_020424 [Daphnia magna]